MTVLSLSSNSKHCTKDWDTWIHWKSYHLNREIERLNKNSFSPSKKKKKGLNHENKDRKRYTLTLTFTNIKKTLIYN